MPNDQGLEDWQLFSSTLEGDNKASLSELARTATALQRDLEARMLCPATHGLLQLLNAKPLCECIRVWSGILRAGCAAGPQPTMVSAI